MRSPIFQIRYRHWVFAPTLLMSILAIVFFGLFLSLGQWQLQRAEYKRSIAQRYQSQLQQDFQQLRLLKTVDPSFRYRKIKLYGHYLEEFQMLLDNQVYQGQAGYHVLTPFMLQHGGQAVLVNRGWVALGRSREKLPKIRAAKIRNEVKGILTIPSNEGYRLGEVAMTNEWPQRIPYIDMQKIQQGFNVPLLPYVIWLAPEVDDYYVREWKPVWSPAEKSEAYALQWFSFAFIVVILFIALNIKKVQARGD